MNALIAIEQPSPVARFCGRSTNKFVTQLFFHIAEPVTLEFGEGGLHVF